MVKSSNPYLMRIAGLLYNHVFTLIARPMEAEQLNQIANRLNDLNARHLALRGYL